MGKRRGERGERGERGVKEKGGGEERKSDKRKARTSSPFYSSMHTL